MALRECGYTVLEATSGEEAMSICGGHKGKIHLLVTDVVMRGMGGRELADRLTGRLSGLQVLFVSGYAVGPVSSPDAPGGPARFLRKPYSAGELVHQVRDILTGVRPA